MPGHLAHAQQVTSGPRRLLQAISGLTLVPIADSGLCCGSAGTYSLLQGELSNSLRERKLGTLLANAPDLILSANIGCIGHLEAGTAVPVRHWIEWIDGVLQGQAG